MIRILHAADLHLDSPFQALGREKALTRRGEQRELLGRIADIAVKEKADLVLLAGDIFDSENMFSETARWIETVLNRLPMPVFIAPGNHDHYAGHSAWQRLNLAENIHVFASDDIRCVSLPELGVRVWGCGFTERYRRPPLTGFEAEKDGDILDVMVLHGEVGVPESNYGAITEQELSRSGMDYVALGHVHRFSGLQKAGETFYAWPGCPEGRGFDETGEKGIILAVLEPGACELTFIPTGLRRYESITVDITGAEDVCGTILRALPPDTGRDIYRICLAGEAEAVPDMKMLAGTLETRFFALELRDETTLRRDIWDGRGNDSLRGLFLSRLWQKMEAASDEGEREKITQAVRWGLQAMENGEELPL